VGRRTCPRCGRAGDRSHEVKVEVRVGGHPSAIPGTGIKVCESCARQLRIEIANVIDGARRGWIAQLGMPMLRELDDERQAREQSGEDHTI
jgi:hypothetical protein